MGKVALTVNQLARHTARHYNNRRGPTQQSRGSRTPRSNTSFARNVAQAAAVAPSDAASVMTGGTAELDAGRDIVEKIKAAILIIGNEILSGRTQDLNVSFISNWLNINCGIPIFEVKIIPDVEKKLFQVFKI